MENVIELLNNLSVKIAKIKCINNNFHIFY